MTFVLPVRILSRATRRVRLISTIRNTQNCKPRRHVRDPVSQTPGTSATLPCVQMTSKPVRVKRLDSSAYSMKNPDKREKNQCIADQACSKSNSSKAIVTNRIGANGIRIEKMPIRYVKHFTRRDYVSSRQSHSFGSQAALQGDSDTTLSCRILRPMVKNMFERHYPSVPQLALSNPAQFFLDLPGIRFDSASCSKNHRKHTVVVQVSLDDGQRLASSCYDTKMLDAAMGAYLKLILQLHSKGILISILASSDKHESLKVKASQDRNSIIDVYNYCVIFKAIPQVTITQLRDECCPWGFKVQIVLEEQQIRVVGTAESAKDALSWAAFLFKREVEGAQRQTCSNFSTLKAGPLTVSSAKELLKYCSSRHPHIMTKIVSRKSSSQYYWEAQPFYNLVSVSQPVFAADKKTAEKLASLVLGLFLDKQYPSLLADFEASLSSTGSLIPKLDPIAFSLPTKTIKIMGESAERLQNSGFNLNATIRSGQQRLDHKRPRILKPMPSGPARSAKAAHMQSKLDEYRFSKKPEVARIRAQRELLPISLFCVEVEHHINENAFSIIIGATGSGKTTQVPQILLEKATSQGKAVDCNIICTQPRRLAATSVAQRVAHERGEQLGHCAGYHVRGDAKLPNAGGSITYCTTGILLKQLQLGPESTLDNISHIIIDEAHERDTLVDFLMAVLKGLLDSRRRKGRQVPRITLMSATIDVSRFSSYFEQRLDDGTTIKCPSLNIPGKLFPVQETYLDEVLHTLRHEQMDFLERDPKTETFMAVEERFSASRDTSADHNHSISWGGIRTFTPDGQLVSEQEEALVPTNLVIATIAHVASVTSYGAILVFLPGIDDIKAVRDGLLGLDTTDNLNIPFNDDSRFHICLLHSTIPVEEQRAVFETTATGCRKVILATNIAETSLTIPDVRHVVDTGKLREKRYDPVTGINRLHCTWISASSAQQRAGRAGRVSRGTYHGLYSLARRRSFENNGSSEIVRSDIQNVCLDVRAQVTSVPIRDFLAQTIEPPPSLVVNAAVRSLQDIAALSAEEEVTPLGRLLSMLPVHPRLGKMIVLGIIFRCLDPIAILSAAMNEPPIFSSPMDMRTEAMLSYQKFLGDSNSDHIAVIEAYRSLRRMLLNDSQEIFESYVSAQFLHKGVFHAIMRTTREIELMLKEVGLVPSLELEHSFEGEIGYPDLNVHSNNVTLIKAIIVSGLAPNLAVAASTRTLRTRTESNVQIHRSSLNRTQPKSVPSDSFPLHSIFSFSSLNKNTSKNTLALRDTTLVTPLAVILFGGDLSTSRNAIHIDDWLTLQLDPPTNGIQSIVKFRKTLDDVLASFYDNLGRLPKTRMRNCTEIDSELLDVQSSMNDTAREAFVTNVVDILRLDDSGELIARAHAVRKAGAKLYGYQQSEVKQSYLS